MPFCCCLLSTKTPVVSWDPRYTGLVLFLVRVSAAVHRKDKFTRYSAAKEHCSELELNYHFRPIISLKLSL